MPYQIEAVTVNHNTSLYMELMLRSLAAHHQPDVGLKVTVVDNASVDDLDGLQAYAKRQEIPIVSSGFTTTTKHNSHGEILSRFVLEHPECTHYLFLDADVCFIEDKTLDVMLQELENSADAFGVTPRMSWDGIAEIPERVRLSNPDLYEARLHPCCALIKNTQLVRDVVREVGLSCIRFLWAEGDEYLDTCKLMTRVMRTHGFRHIISSRMVLHFFCASYDWDPDNVREQKAQQRDGRLAELRARETGPLRTISHDADQAMTNGSLDLT
jgi:hypothetical protein